MNALTNKPFRCILTPILAGLATALLAVPASAEQVIFSEIHYNPPAGKPEFIEIYNNTSTPFDIGKWYLTDGVTFTFPDFDPARANAHILRPFERILVSDVDAVTLRAAYPIPAATRIYGPWTGALSNAGETITLCNKNGVAMTELTYDDNGKWPVAPDGTGHTLTRINPNLMGGEWRNWTSSATPGGTPGSGPIAEKGQTTQIADTTSTWKYDQEGNDLGTAWREPGFDDSSWAEGPGVFGKDGIDRGFQTPWVTGGRITYYLRKAFQWDSAFSSATIDIEALLDDGAVVYLNGQEIARKNLPAGTIDYLTPASSSEANALEDIATGTDIAAALQVGTNLLAVEVHNQSSGSSDIVFGGNFSITATPEDLSNLLVISEIHFGTDGRADWVELHAPGQSAVGVSSMAIASLTDRSDATPLTGSVPGGGYASFDVDFPVEPNGNISLFLALGNSVLDAHKFDRDHGEESFQSVPVGREFYGGPGHTRDAPNNPSARITDIVINEIMYDPPSDQTNGEFIELYNRGNSSVDLSNWRLTDGVSFDFPPGSSLAPGAYLVVAADAACLTSAHGGLQALGNWSGSLRDGGEHIRLEDSNGNLADEVDYLPGGDWPNLADGDGSSMELRHPQMDNDFASAWADSDESQKAPLKEFAYTADFERATWNPLTGPQELHAHLVGDAHVVIKNVSLKRNNNGPNLLSKPEAMSPDNRSSEGWVTQGTHWASYMDSGELHLISDGHGDNKANRAEVDTAALTVNESHTLSFEARWVSGKSRVIFQTLDHGFGTSFLLPIPQNLGTPGSPNSALLASAAPTISGVTHSPAVPKPNSQVKVSARVTSADTLASVTVFYRLDKADIAATSTAADWKQATMTDDGTGLFSASLNEFTQNANIVQFYVEAKTDGNRFTRLPQFVAAPPIKSAGVDPLNSPPVIGPARPAMWIVDNRDMLAGELPGELKGGGLLRERFIISEYDRRALTTGTGHSPTFDYNFPRMSNHFFNATFIANESEIFYNAEIRKSGSPFTRNDNSNIDHGKWKLPGDRLFRGRHRSVIDASGTPEGSGTPRFYDDRIARYFLYQLGHPTNEMEYVYSVVNNLAFKLRENQEPIANDMLDRNFADGSEGTLLRIDDEWRFTSDDGNSRDARDADWAYKNSDNPIRYHSEWIMRSREADYDYSNFIEFVRTLRPGNNFDEATIDRLADADMLCINAAVRGYDGDWDTITVNRGKNAYFYRPKDGNGWMLLHWDGDRVFEAPYDRAIIGGRPGIGTYFNKPYIKRHLNYYLTKLLDEHTKGSVRTQAWMDAETAAVAGTGITMTASHYTSWFANREPYVRNTFITAAVSGTPFAISTSNAATANDTINLAGTAPPTIYAVRVLGQDSPNLHWTESSLNGWTLSGVQLRTGVNTLQVQGIDHLGRVISELPFSITKTNNAPPVVVVGSAPRSQNVSLGEMLVLDASASYDPEGGALSFTWQVSPPAGVNLVPNGASATASFTRPGLYSFSATATDPQAQSATRTLGVAVYGPQSFATFGNGTLDPYWGLSDIDKHGNSPNSPNFSLQDHPGRLTINIPLARQVVPKAPVQYFDYGSTWRYDDTGADLSSTFAQPGFDDSAWPTGTGFLGYGGITSGPPNPPGFQTDLARNLLAYYFRSEFEFSGETVGAQLNIDQLVDDGVVYYLNGQEIGRVRMPAGPVNGNTAALSGASEQIEAAAVQASITGALVNGTNVFAAEVHNQSIGSSDLVFGARVSIAEGSGAPSPDDATPAWVRRALPSTADWVLQTEVKLEKSQFGDFLAGLLVEALENGSSVRYGIAFDGGDSISATRGGTSGSPTKLANVPAVAANVVSLRLERRGSQLLFSWETGNAFTQIHQVNLPANTTFRTGGIFASTSNELQSLEASFDYAMLIDSTPASTAPLVVSEIMYHPTGDVSALEFIELYNAGPTALDLTGFKTVGTEPFDEFVFPAYLLQPGGYALLVANQASFLNHYGAFLAPQIIGQWTGGVLSNGGELITLTDASGALITSFTYDDQAPWPTTPDGDGPSLVINDVDGGLDPNVGTNWHASLNIGGSPGSAEGTAPGFDDWMADNGFTDPDAEYAGSGLSNLLAYALGRDLSNASVAPAVTDSGGFAAFSYRQRLGDASLTYAVEASTDLDTWHPADDLSPSGSPIPNGDGTQTVTLLSNTPTPGRPDTYYRLRVTAPE